jgi:hypothetical protein
MVLQDAAVDVELGGSFDPASIRIILLSPDGTISVLLHDRDAIPAAVLKGKPGKGVSFPKERTPVQPLRALAEAGVQTRGDWRLMIQNNGPSATLVGWSLRLQGQPVFDVYGTVTDGSTNGLGNALVALDGLSISQFATSINDGTFVFHRLPGIPLNFTTSLPGFEPLDYSTPGVLSAYTIPHFDDTCSNPTKASLVEKFRPLPAFPVPGSGVPGFEWVGGQQSPVALRLTPRAEITGPLVLLADPMIGFAPLSVEFNVLSTNNLPPGTTFNLNYGDGDSEILAGRSATHTYMSAQPDGYIARVDTTFAGSTNVTLYAMPSPRHSDFPNNFFLVNFTGGGTLPPGFVAPGVTTNTPQLADLIHVQHAYAASLDLDLAPTNVVGASFDADGFDKPGQYAPPINREGNFRVEDHNYGVPAGTDRFKGQWSLANECDYPPRDISEANIRDSYPKQGATGDCAGPRFVMLCNIGSQILPQPNSEVVSLSANSPPYQFVIANPDPLLAVGRGSIAQSRDLKLVTGPLAQFWRTGGPQ